MSARSRCSHHRHGRTRRRSPTNWSRTSPARAGAAIGAVVGRLADVGEHDPEVHDAMQKALDERDEEGRTQRERLDEARRQMQRMGGSTAIGDSAGGSLIGGLLGGLSEAMEQLGDQSNGDGPNDDQSNGGDGDGDR